MKPTPIHCECYFYNSIPQNKGLDASTVAKANGLQVRCSSLINMPSTHVPLNYIQQKILSP